MSGELGPEARGILEAGRDGDDPTGADRVRVRSALMQAMAVGGAGAALGLAGKASASVAPKAAAGVIAAAKTTTGFGLGAKLVGLFVVASAIGGGGYALSRSQVNDASKTAERAVETAAAPATTAAAARDRAPVPPPRAPAAEQPTPAEEPLAALPPAAPPAAAPTLASEHRTPVAAVSPRAADPLAPAASVDPLVAESRQLREAHAAMQDGDARRALTLLDAQGRTNAGGQLGEEREAMRVFALCKLGRLDEAKTVAARFRVQHPQSPLADRMRGPCDEAR